MDVKLELLELASCGAESDPHKFGRVLAGVVQESLREARAPGGMAEAVSETQMQACASCLSHNKTRDIWTGDAGHHGHLRQFAFSSRAGGQNLLECTSVVSFVKRCSLQDDCDARLEDLEKQLEQLMEGRSRLWSFRGRAENASFVKRSSRRRNGSRKKRTRKPRG